MVSIRFLRLILADRWSMVIVVVGLSFYLGWTIFVVTTVIVWVLLALAQESGKAAANINEFVSKLAHSDSSRFGHGFDHS